MTKRVKWIEFSPITGNKLEKIGVIQGWVAGAAGVCAVVLADNEGTAPFYVVHHRDLSLA